MKSFSFLLELFYQQIHLSELNVHPKARKHVEEELSILRAVGYGLLVANYALSLSLFMYRISRIWKDGGWMSLGNVVLLELSYVWEFFIRNCFWGEIVGCILLTFEFNFLSKHIFWEKEYKSCITLHFTFFRICYKNMDFLQMLSKSGASGINSTHHIHETHHPIPISSLKRMYNVLTGTFSWFR